jgi:malate dehydrogenase (oxaloacetate-decarboxylating)(NADP+)
VAQFVKQRRNYGLPASAIGLGTDPRKDKTVQLTNLRGVNVIHDPLLSKVI